MYHEQGFDEDEYFGKQGGAVPCDVCGYEDEGAVGNVVQPGPDGVLRCKVCRHRLMYGRYVYSDSEEFRLLEAGAFTEEYRRILEEYGGEG